MGMLAKVEGEVFVRTDAKTTNIQFYEEEFILDDDIKDIAIARSIIRKAMIHDRLRKTIKNYKKFRTCQVISLKPVSTKAETTDVERKMIEAAKLNCVPMNLDSYATDQSKEKALDKAIESAKVRKAQVKKTGKKDIQIEDEGYID